LEEKRVNQKYTFYAKQTQFPENQNKHNSCPNKTLCQYSPSQQLQKQTQFKANRTQSPKPQNELNLLYNNGLRKKNNDFTRWKTKPTSEMNVTFY